jgi:hypothetical protein
VTDFAQKNITTDILAFGAELLGLQLEGEPELSPSYDSISIQPKGSMGERGRK